MTPLAAKQLLRPIRSSCHCGAAEHECRLTTACSGRCWSAAADAGR